MPHRLLRIIFRGNVFTEHAIVFEDTLTKKELHFYETAEGKQQRGFPSSGNGLGCAVMGKSIYSLLQFSLSKTINVFGYATLN